MAEFEDNQKKDCEKKATELGFDLTKQFLTIAFAGIAFVVGLSLNATGIISTLMLWLTVGTFGVSAVLGLLFLMHGVSLLSVSANYDIYDTSLRLFAGAQIVLVLLGVMLLIPVLNVHAPKSSGSNAIEVRVDQQKSVVYPIDPMKNITIEAEGGRVKITAVNK